MGVRTVISNEGIRKYDAPNSGSSTEFTGTQPRIVATALSGSLTKLADGTSYMLAGTNASVVSGSNGSVTVTALPSYTTSTATAAEIKTIYTFTPSNANSGNTFTLIDAHVVAQESNSAAYWLIKIGLMRFDNVVTSIYREEGTGLATWYSDGSLSDAAVTVEVVNNNLVFKCQSLTENLTLWGGTFRITTN